MRERNLGKSLSSRHVCWASSGVFPAKDEVDQGARGPPRTGRSAIDSEAATAARLWLTHLRALGTTKSAPAMSMGSNVDDDTDAENELPRRRRRPCVVLVWFDIVCRRVAASARYYIRPNNAGRPYVSTIRLKEH